MVVTEVMQLIQDHDGDPDGLLDGLVALAAQDPSDQLQRALKVAQFTAAIPQPAMDEMAVEIERQTAALDDDDEIRALRETLEEVAAQHRQLEAEHGHIVQLDRDATALAGEVATVAAELAVLEERVVERRERVGRRRALLEEVQP